MRLIDANALIEAILDARRSETDTVPKLVRFIEKQPTVAIDDDLISRERLMDDLSDNAGWDFTSKIGMIISRQPTVESKHGRWIKKEERVWYWYECSECGERPLFRNGERVLSDYCPNCGARMEEDDAD